MTTNSKDFIVKNGLVVTNGGTFGDAVTVGAPTSNSHATTKSYVDNAISQISGGAEVTVGETEPSSPSNGDFWLDTTIDRMKVYYSGAWIVLATYEDSQSIPQHIHDTSIDGTGLIVDVFTDSAQINSNGIIYLDGGSPSTTSFDLVLDGGTV